MKTRVSRNFFTISSVTLILLAWEGLPENNLFVKQFGGPLDALKFMYQKAGALAYASGTALASSFLALLLAGFLSIALLIIGLRRRAVLTVLERFATITQTLPIQITVLVIYASLSMFCNRAKNGCSLNVLEIALLPTVIALFFPPFIYGLRAVADLPFEMKALIRVWGAKPGWRIFRVYVPHAIPNLLTGLKVSSAWAVPAVIVCQSYSVSADGGKTTLGYFIKLAFRSMHGDEIVTMALITTLSGLLVYWLTGFLQGNIESYMQGNIAAKESDYHWH